VLHHVRHRFRGHQGSRVHILANYQIKGHLILSLEAEF
jgi:hypothetical protein